MKALVVLALTGSIGVLAACGDDGNGTGAGGYTPGVIAQVAAGTGPKSSASSGSTSAGETSSTTQASTAMSTARASNSASTGMISDPLLPFCGCITDNLSSIGLCQSCWDAAVAPKGPCDDLIMTCGQACSDMLDALSTECGMTATPACLEMVAAIAPNQVDDFAAVLQCICACPTCDNEACM
jgi:hypothetical protein